jgi:hypothetical protein
MAVLYSYTPGYVLRPDKPAELLQGLLNIESTEGVNNGKLTKANLESYKKKQFFAVDSNSSVATYLNDNFAKIAANDGDATSISADDLVQVRSGLPTPAPTTQQPPTTTPNNQAQQIFSFLTQMMQRFFQMFSSFFGQQQQR